MCSAILETDCTSPPKEIENKRNYFNEYMNRLDEFIEMGTISVPDYLIISLLKKLSDKLGNRENDSL
jgi:hypothetical protein